MTAFAIAAALLVLVAAAFLLPPLWRVRSTAGADRQAANLAIFRDQMGELERERREGSLAEADFEQAKRELQNRLLDEARPEAAVALAGDATPSRKAAIALIVLVPVLAMAGYAVLGNPKALNPAFTTARPEMTPEQIEGMVAKLAERMQANPDDMQGWIMLGRSYKALGRPGDAAAAYAKAEKLIAEDAGLLADYAEAIAMSSETGMQGKPRQLVDRALKLDPQNPHALLLAGAAAMQAGNRAEAVSYWEKLLPMVEPGSEMDNMLRSSIEKLKQKR